MNVRLVCTSKRRVPEKGILSLRTCASSMTSPLLMSFVARSTDSGFMWLPEPRSSLAPHFDGQRWLSEGTCQLWAPAISGTATKTAATAVVVAFMISPLLVEMRLGTGDRSPFRPAFLRLLLDLGSRYLHDLRPLGDFGADEGPVLLGGSRRRGRALLGEALLHVGQSDGAVDLAVQPHYDVARRARWSQDPERRDCLIAWHARLGDRGYIGHPGIALCGGDCDGTQPAGLDI